jgi:hypothetical protein
MVRLLQPQQVRAHLRLVEAGGIAAVLRRQLADKPQILLLRGPGEGAQLQGLGEAHEGLTVGNTNSARAALAGRRVRGYLTGGF